MSVTIQDCVVVVHQPTTGSAVLTLFEDKMSILQEPNMRNEAAKPARKPIIDNLDLLYNPRETTIDEFNFYTCKH